MGEFCNATISGHGNVFEDNLCGAEGGVIAATVSTSVTVEGGNFSRNESKDVREGESRCFIPEPFINLW